MAEAPCPTWLLCAARLVAAIEDVMRELQDEGQLDPHFDVPHASLHVGKITGGSAINIVADRCQFDWEIRHLPHETFDALRARVAARERALEAQYPGLRIETTPTTATIRRLRHRSGRLPAGGNADAYLRPRQHPSGASG